MTPHAEAATRSRERFWVPSALVVTVHIVSARGAMHQTHNTTCNRDNLKSPNPISCASLQMVFARLLRVLVADKECKGGARGVLVVVGNHGVVGRLRYPQKS